MSEQKTTDNFDLDEIELPAKRVTGEDMKEVLNANTYHNILPARYLQKNEEGEVVETPDEMFDRIAKNVALADAVYVAEDQGYEIQSTPSDIKPKASSNRRQQLCDKVFGPDVSLEDDEVTVQVTEDNVHAFAYDSIVPKLPENVREPVEQTRHKFYDDMTSLSFMPNSPTIMNAGDDFQQLSACFVDSPKDDIDNIHETSKEAAKIFQCLTEDSTVIEKNRGIISVSGVKGGDTILQQSEEGFQYKTVKETHTYESSPTITLELENGLEIQGTPNHELLVNEKWTRLDQVSESDEIHYSLGWIEELESSSPVLETVSEGAQWNRKVSNEDIFELYQNGLSDHKIAEKLDVGKSTVQRRRSDEMQLPPNSNAGRTSGHTTFDEQKAIQMYKNGMTDGQISDELDISKATVQRFRNSKSMDPNGTPVKQVTQPQHLTTQVAELVGLWAGDGSYHSDGVRFHISREGTVQWLEETVQDVFDTSVSKTYSDGCYNVTINSHEIKRFWKKNFDVKSNSSKNVTVPSVISKSTPPDIKGYLRGYASADGSLQNDSYPVIYSSSEDSIEQMASLMMGLGMPVKKSCIRDSDENPYYSVCPTTEHGRQLFRTEVGFLGDREVQPVDNPIDTEYDGNGDWTASVDCVEVDEDSDVYDITVEDNHQYITDGIVSHNSGGGMGYAFSRLRPYGDRVGSTGGIASGPISFMRTYDQMCGTIAQGGRRRGAQMGILKIDHPDIIQFIHAKDKDVSLAHSLKLNDPDDFTHNSFGEALEEARGLVEVDQDGIERVPEHLRNAAEGHLSNFNISVGVTDKFMEAVKNDEQYTLINPRTDDPYIANEETKELYSWFGLGDEITVGEEMTLPAREIFERITEGAWDNGEPGMIFLERSNKEHSFDVEKHPEHEILSTNPCVAKGTLVNTPNGYRPVEDIDEGDKVSTTIGSESVDEIEVHDDYQVYRVKFSDGSYLDVTAEHRFNILDGKEVVDNIPLRDVSEGDFVRLEPTPVEDEGTDEEYRRYLKKGVLLGDGCYTPRTLERHNIVKIASSEDDDTYNDHVKTLFIDRDFRADDTSSGGKSMNMVMKNGQRIVDELNLEPAKSHNKDFDVTNINTKKQAIGILDGLLATDGNVNLNSNHPQIRWDTSSYEMAQSIRNTLLMLGCHGRITISDKADRGGTIDDRKISANYDKHTVNVSGESARKYAEYTDIELLHPDKGEQMRELQMNWMTTGNTWKAKVESIEEVDETETVYDLYCEESDTWVTEGYVSRGCGEQPLEEYEACNLGHINLSTIVSESSPDWRKFSQEADEDLSVAVERFLDESVDWDEFNGRIRRGTHFLENVVTMSDFPVDKITEKVSNNRKIGLGIMGLAQMYIQMGIKYGTGEANEVAKQMMKHINHHSKTVSHQIATGDKEFTERGSFNNWSDSKYADPEEYAEWFEKYTGESAEEWSDGYHIRNHNTTTIAPTGTTSMIGDTSGGCEPIYQVAYYKNVTQDVQGDEMLVEFDDYFLRFLEANGIDIKAVKEEAQRQMANNEFQGVDSLDRVPDEIGELFVTTGDLTSEQHAEIQCALQKGVDSAISKTINAPSDATPEEAADAFMKVYDMGGKGITYYRDGTRSKQVLTTREDNQDTQDPVNVVQEKIENDEIELADLGVEEQSQTTTAVVGEEVVQPMNRPKSLDGKTKEVRTGYGDLFVTINEVEEGEPFEVFANIGKSGGYTESFTESTARLISLCLRCGIDPNDVVEQIEGIRSPKVSWDEGDQVFSVPDGIAVALRRYLDEANGTTEERSENTETVTQPIQQVTQDDEEEDESSRDVIDAGENPECPECGSLTLYYSEGCKKCESCGWSEC